MARKSKQIPAIEAQITAHDQSARSRDTEAKIAKAGPSMVVSEIVLRSVGRLTRHALEKAIARRRHAPAKAKAIVDNRTILHTVAAYGVTKLATRSVPGALLVGGGLLAKTLYDRGAARRQSRKAAKDLPATKSAD